MLTPTRELAAQVQNQLVAYTQYSDLRTAVVLVAKINPQISKLQKGVDILVATPGRLLDLHQQDAVHFDHLEVLVLTKQIACSIWALFMILNASKTLPKHRQTLMFSATFSKDIQKLAKGLMKDPKVITLNPDNSTVKSIKQWLIPVDKKQKSALLFNLMVDKQWTKAIIFTRTKHGANRLTRYCKNVAFMLPLFWQ